MSLFVLLHLPRKKKGEVSVIFALKLDLIQWLQLAKDRQA